MNISLSLAKKLLRLCNGEKLPFSGLNYTEILLMIENGILRKQMSGRNRSVIYLPDELLLIPYLKNHFGINDLRNFIQVLEKEEIKRSDLAVASSDSKTKSIRTFHGFPVNCSHQIRATLNKRPFIIQPIEGISTFINDFENFIPDKNVTIVGIENAENFMYPEILEKIFSRMNPLYVSRYPQNSDLSRWLRLISNQYVHFGDFDFAGLNIYVNEYKKHLKTRAKFFIPENIESLIIKYGNRSLYDKQAICFDTDSVNEANVITLIKLIHKHHKALEQEILSIL
jgi:hypothetical protein